MNEEKLLEIFQKYKAGLLGEKEFIEKIKASIVKEALNVKIDGLRELRKGYPETVFCLRKTPEQAKLAFEKVFEAYGKAMATKAKKEHYEAIKEIFPKAEFYPESGVIRLIEKEEKKVGFVPVFGAGTSDYPVCEEALLTLDFLGSNTEMVLDVGVAGIHRLASAYELLRKANCAIVVAGMEGALPSLIAGIAPVPVIGVPTSVGYGTSFNGLTALFSMLNSCAEGLVVVNIDNGFGAAVAAHMINLLAVEGGNS